RDIVSRMLQPRAYAEPSKMHVVAIQELLRDNASVIDSTLEHAEKFLLMVESERERGSISEDERLAAYSRVADLIAHVPAAAFADVYLPARIVDQLERSCAAPSRALPPGAWRADQAFEAPKRNVDRYE